MISCRICRGWRPLEHASTPSHEALVTHEADDQAEQRERAAEAEQPRHQERLAKERRDGLLEERGEEQGHRDGAGARAPSRRRAPAPQAEGADEREEVALALALVPPQLAGELGKGAAASAVDMQMERAVRPNGRRCCLSQPLALIARWEVAYEGLQEVGASWFSRACMR